MCIYVFQDAQPGISPTPKSPPALAQKGFVSCSTTSQHCKFDKRGDGHIVCQVGLTGFSESVHELMHGQTLGDNVDIFKHAKSCLMCLDDLATRIRIYRQIP